MKVFIVSKTESDYSYSDFAILKVFSDEKKANDFRDRCQLITEEYERCATVVSQKFNEWKPVHPRPNFSLSEKSSKAEYDRRAQLWKLHLDECTNKRAELQKENLELSAEDQELAIKYILNCGYSCPTFSVLEHEVED